jgi:hypothetical protein
MFVMMSARSGAADSESGIEYLRRRRPSFLDADFFEVYDRFVAGQEAMARQLPGMAERFSAATLIAFMLSQEAGKARAAALPPKRGATQRELDAIANRYPDDSGASPPAPKLSAAQPSGKTANASYLAGYIQAAVDAEIAKHLPALRKERAAARDAVEAAKNEPAYDEVVSLHWPHAAKATDARKEETVNPLLVGKPSRYAVGSDSY